MKRITLNYTCDYCRAEFGVVEDARSLGELPRHWFAFYGTKRDRHACPRCAVARSSNAAKSIARDKAADQERERTTTTK